MTLNASFTAAARQDEAVEVHIVGPSILQNELLIAFLETNMSVECRQHEKLEPALIAEKGAGGRRIIMIDCLGRNRFKPWVGFNINPMLDSATPFVTLYNVHQDSGVEFAALEQGIRGIFYIHESFKFFPKAIKVMLDGELWYPRKVLSEWVTRGCGACNANPLALTSLTAREKEIFLMIVSGVGNQSISESLCISPHTVKTHIYNIYCKLNLKNRTQASQWAAKNLWHSPPGKNESAVVE